MSIEISQTKETFERLRHQEVERKFIALDGTLFDRYRPEAHAITQLYLSQPEDEYSLRLRKSVAPDGQATYTATLKDRGVATPEGLARMEIETPITEAAFYQYKTEGYPTLHKSRTELCDGVTIDWIDGSDTPIIEVENTGYNESASQFLALCGGDLLEQTGKSDVDNESLAHSIAGERAERTPQVTAEEIMQDILGYRSLGMEQLVIGIGGRSGSGKSTLARQLQEAIATNPQLGDQVALVSTDDYHRGRRHLETTYGAPWTDWEDARVYDTSALAKDIAQWRQGEQIARRGFDFTTEEPVTGEPLPPSTILIVEGIHAGSRDLAGERQMYYEVKTPLSVSLGRDLQRLLATDRQQAAMKSPEERLRYMIEIGEPTYRTIEQARRNNFSGCARPLGERGIALTAQPEAAS